MILVSKILVFITGIMMLVYGGYVVFAPEPSQTYLPLSIDSDQLANTLRAFGGVFLALGYLNMRFLNSSSKVQIGTVMIYVVGCMLIGKITGYIYDGYTTFSIATGVFGLILFISLIILHRARKNEISYDL
jgi:hypothetical protein